MRYRIRSEEMGPNPKSQAIIQDAINNIKPDVDSLSHWYPEYATRQKRRLAFDIDHLLHYAPIESKVLEVGSIPLILTVALKQIGFNIQGIDVLPERFQSAINFNELDIRKQDIEKDSLDFIPGEFDTVIFNEVFEHLRINPIFTLKEIHKVLRPKGLLMLSTPNFMALRNIKSLTLHNKSRADIYVEYMKLQLLGHMGHVRLYTPTEVCTFLQKIGFEIVEIIYRGTSDEPQWKGVVENNLFRIMPKFRPFFSIIAIKNNNLK